MQILRLFYRNHCITNRLNIPTKKEKKKSKRDTSAAPVLYAKLIYSEKTKKIRSLFRTKGRQKVNPFNYLNQYCHVKMAFLLLKVSLLVRLLHLFK